MLLHNLFAQKNVLDQELNSKTQGDGMLQPVTHFYIVPGSLLVDLRTEDT